MFFFYLILKFVQAIDYFVLLYWVGILSLVFYNGTFKEKVEKLAIQSKKFLAKHAR